MTPEEYLRNEHAAETKSEYDNGVLHALAGAGERHHLIVAGLIASLVNRVAPSCRVYPSDMKLRVAKTRLFYSDATVVCDDPQFEDDKRDVLLNPLIVFEVLSEDSEHRDRGPKFHAYLSAESVKQYVLVWHDEAVVERYRRDATQWVYSSANGLDATLSLPAARCHLPLREIYLQAC